MRNTHFIDTDEVLVNARTATDLHEYHYRRATWLAWIAGGSFAAALVFAFLFAAVGALYVSNRASIPVRVLGFEASGQGHTWISGTTGFSANDPFVRNSMKYYLRAWAEGWFARLRDPSLGPEVKEAHLHAYMWLSEDLNHKELAKEQNEKTIETFLAGGAEQYRVDARAELVGVEQAAQGGPAKGVANVHMVYTFYDGQSVQTGKRAYVTQVHFRVDPGYLGKLTNAADIRKADDLATYNPLVLTIESFTPPEQE